MSDIKDPFDSLQDYFSDLLDVEPIRDESSSGESSGLLSLVNSTTKSESLTESNLAESNLVESNRASANVIEHPRVAIGSSAAISERTLVTGGRAKKSALKSPRTPIKQASIKPDTPDTLPAFAEPALDQKAKLQRLLQTATIPIEIKTEVKRQVETKAKTQFVDDPNEIQDWVVTPYQDSTLVPVIVEIPIENSTPAESHNLLVSDTQALIPGLEWKENGRPEWAQSRFDVLLFSVSGLSLAVPLIALGQIQPLTTDLTPIFGQADWFMGLLPSPQGQIRTVNTAKFVMPERYDERFLETAKYVMTINGVPWGLAVDSVNQPISLDPEDVKWRTDRGKRPWLAGTVKEHMCALLDIPRVGQLLMESDKNLIKKSL